MLLEQMFLEQMLLEQMSLEQKLATLSEDSKELDFRRPKGSVTSVARSGVNHDDDDDDDANVDSNGNRKAKSMQPFETIRNQFKPFETSLNHLKPV
jgi:hypothetical protein